MVVFVSVHPATCVENERSIDFTPPVSFASAVKNTDVGPSALAESEVMTQGPRESGHPVPVDLKLMVGGVVSVVTEVVELHADSSAAASIAAARIGGKNFLIRTLPICGVGKSAVRSADIEGVSRSAV